MKGMAQTLNHNSSMAALQSTPNLGDGGVFSAALLEVGTSALMQANKHLQKQFITSPAWAAGCFVCSLLWIFSFSKGPILFFTLSGDDGQGLSPHCQQQPGAD